LIPGKPSKSTWVYSSEADAIFFFFCKSNMVSCPIGWWLEDLRNFNENPPEMHVSYQKWTAKRNLEDAAAFPQPC
jgi:hypothetical protein